MLSSNDLYRHGRYRYGLKSYDLYRHGQQVFSSNIASVGGGAGMVLRDAHATMRNVTIRNNRASYGGGWFFSGDAVVLIQVDMAYILMGYVVMAYSYGLYRTLYGGGWFFSGDAVVLIQVCWHVV